MPHVSTCATIHPELCQKCLTPQKMCLVCFVGDMAQDHDVKVPSRCWGLPHVNKNGESHSEAGSKQYPPTEKCGGFGFLSPRLEVRILRLHQGVRVCLMFTKTLKTLQLKIC